MTAPPYTPTTPITADHLHGLSGLRRRARDALLAAQPRTVREALRIPDIGRKTAHHLLALGLLEDDDHVRERANAYAVIHARLGS